MNTKIIIVSLLPSIFWGLMPIIASKTKSHPAEQLLGTTITAFFFSIFIQLFLNNPVSKKVAIICFFSGCFWGVGQYLQFHVINKLPVSTIMPISNGSQLVFTSSIGAVIFREWNNMRDITIGVFALAIIIIGISLTSYQENKKSSKVSIKLKKESIILLLFSSICFSIYVTLPRIFNISGLNIIFPQSIGMLFTSMYFTKYKKGIRIEKVLKNIPTGLSWSIANTSLFILIPILGISLSFTLSQLSVIVSVYAGIFLLKDIKNKKESIFLFVGTILFIIGIVMISLTK